MQQQNWTTDASPSTLVDGYSYGYDADGNRLWRANDTATGLDEAYQYNGENELTGYQQGTLNTTTHMITAPSKANSYTLDSLGNWSQLIQSQSGTTTLNQSRSDDNANEISGVSNTVGEAWATPVYDQAGNMTTMPQPGNETAALTCVYDGWNRLVEVKSGTTILAQYAFDGAGRRVAEYTNFAGTSPGNVSYYFFDGHNEIETRATTSPTAAASSLPTQYQYVWSLAGVKDPILRDSQFSGTNDNDPQLSGRVYYLTDANDNVTAVVQPWDQTSTPCWSGTGGTQWQLAERYAYDPYVSP